MAQNKLNIVIRFSSLGDIVLCSSFIAKLRHQSPHETIALVTLDGLKDIVRSFETQPQWIWGMPNSSFKVFAQSWQTLKNAYSTKPFDTLCIFDLHKVPKSFAFRWAAFCFCIFNKIQYRSKSTSKNSFFRWMSVLFKKDFSPKRHIYIEHQKLLNPSHQHYLPQLRKAPLADPAKISKILVAPDSQHWKKKWPISHWEVFFDLAFTELPNTEFTLVGGQDVFPQDLIDSLRDRFGDRFKNRLGRLPLSDLGLIASTHSLCICGNSAWQHISESVEVPVISIPGPIISGFGFSPFLDRSRELSVNLKCRPCTRHGGGNCHLSGDDFHACMKKITPLQVLENCKELLK